MDVKLKTRFQNPPELSKIRKGKFLVFEGGEGAGKTTQLAHLVSYFRGLGVNVISTREPGGTAIAEELRTLMVKGRADKIGPKTEAMLMYAARNDHIEKVIKPALMRGDWVISDRFEWSTFAYQAAAGSPMLNTLSDMVVGDNEVRPDLVIYMDINPAVGLMRVARRAEDKSRFEDKAMEFHQNVREVFLKHAKGQMMRSTDVFTVHVGDRSEDEIRYIIQHRVEDLFGIVTSENQE